MTDILRRFHLPTLLRLMSKMGLQTEPDQSGVQETADPSFASHARLIGLTCDILLSTETEERGTVERLRWQPDRLELVLRLEDGRTAWLRFSTEAVPYPDRPDTWWFRTQSIEARAHSLIFRRGGTEVGRYPWEEAPESTTPPAAKVIPFPSKDK